MKILIIHKGFPGQFKHLIPILQNRGDQIITISRHSTKKKIIKDKYYFTYKPSQGNGKDTLPLASEIESKIIRGEAVAVKAFQLAKSGFNPCLILGHPGWGEMLFLGDIWPKTPQIHYAEFFYGIPGTDNDIEDIYTKNKTWEDKAKSRLKNLNILANLNQMHTGLTPTKFQHSLLPAWAKEKTSIIHDGIDTDWLCPDPNEILITPSGHKLKKGDPIITFVNRTFEPYRGIHIFLEGLARLQLLHPTAHVLLVGLDTPKVSYGASRKDHQGWVSALKLEMKSRLDWSRIHLLGQVTHHTLRSVYRISAAHVYLTYPFILSWSLLEAMSCESLVVGSATAPVMELIKNNRNGILVPFNNPERLCEVLLDILNNPQRYESLRQAARKHIVSNYRLKDCVNNQIDLIDKVAMSR